MLIPGLGVSYEIFKPLIEMLEDNFHIIAVEVDGFTLGRNTEFTSTYSLMTGKTSCSIASRCQDRNLQRNESRSASN